MVSKGSEVLITKRGKPVAHLCSVSQEIALSDDQLAARERSRARMQQGYSLGGERFDRDLAYDR